MRRFDLMEKGYTCPVSLNSGIGFGSPCNHCDESRSLSADRAALSFVPQFMAARMGGFAARRFTQVVPGLPTRSSCRPLSLGVAVVARRLAWRPTMTQSFCLPVRPSVRCIPLSMMG